jgi:hypothetical protein
MIIGAKTNVINIAVSTARALLNVIYLNTLNGKYIV